MYLLTVWFAATPERAAASRWNRILAISAGQLPRMSARSSGVHPFGVIHCVLRKHTRASSGTLPLGQNLKFPLEDSSAVGFAKPVAGMSLPLRALPPSGLAPVHNKRERQSGSRGMRRRRRMHALHARRPPTAESPLRRHRESVRASRPLRTRHPSDSNCR